MALKNVFEQIDAEIARLQQAKSLLTASGAPEAFSTVRPDRPKRNVEVVTAPPPAKKKRNLSPEGRARIAETAKRRWAAQKKKQKGKE